MTMKAGRRNHYSVFDYDNYYGDCESLETKNQIKRLFNILMTMGVAKDKSGSKRFLYDTIS